jgi:hypothetical protein
MTNNKNDNYANLPDELLEDILEDAPKIAEKIKPLFNELQQQRKTHLFLLLQRLTVDKLLKNLLVLIL